MKRSISTILAVMFVFSMLFSSHVYAAAPTKPTGVSATVTSNTLTVRWNTVSGATSYTVSVNGDARTTTSTSYTYTGLTPNTRYGYAVKATNSSGSSAYSTTQYIYTSAISVPSIPTGVTATANGTSVTVSWNAVSGATSYNVNFNGSITSGITTTSKTYTGLTPGNTYSYSVSAKNSGGSSSYSSTQNITVPVATPSVPTGLNASATASTALISWTSVSGATSYDVILGSTTQNTSSTTATFTGLTPGTTYTYQVRSKNSYGSSSYASASVTTIAFTNNAAVLLYVGAANSRTTSITYAPYSSTDLTTMLSATGGLGTKEFVILGGDCGYGFTDAVTLDVINQLNTAGSVPNSYVNPARTTNDINNMITSCSTLYNDIKNATSTTRSMNSFADYQINLANQIWNIDPNVKIWFSAPLIPPEAAVLAYRYNNVIKTQLIDYIKNNINSTYWTNNVLGFYYGTEQIGSYSTNFNTSNTTDFGNPIVNNMKSTSDYVKNTYGKKMLWIPFYSTDSEALKRVGYVVNKTNIFNYADFQPNYYFNSSSSAKINSVKTCVTNNAVVDSSNNIIGGTKTSSTNVGVEMEIDSNYASDSNYQSRYNSYVSAFGNFRGSKHISFYCGSRPSLMTIFNIVRQFILKL